MHAACELEGVAESRRGPGLRGRYIVISLDYDISAVCRAGGTAGHREKKQADSVSILIMNPKNGEIYAMSKYARSST